MTQSKITTTPNKESERDKPAKPRQIEGEIGQTREAISGDIRALGDKLSPDALKEGAKDMAIEVKDAAVDKVREAKDNAVEKAREVKDTAMEKAREVKDVAVQAVDETVHEVSEKLEEAGDMARRAGDATWSFVRMNAVPLTLMGLGAGLMMANSRSRRTTVRTYEVEEPGMYEYGLEQPYEYGTERRSLNSNAGRARARARQTGERAQAAVHRASERTQGTMHDITRRVSEGAAHTRDLARHQYDQIRQKSETMVQEHPLAVGAALLALGIGVGAMLPSSRRENMLLGETRDRFVDEARTAVRNVGDVARETTRSLS